MDIREIIIKSVVSLLQERVPEEVINTVQDVLILELNQYEVQERCTAVTISDNSAEGLLKRYVATKRIEGLSDSTLRRYADENLKLIRFLRKPLYEITTNDLYLYKEGNKVILTCYQLADITNIVIPESFRPTLTVRLSANYYTTDWKYYPGRLAIKHDGSIEVAYFTEIGGKSTTATTGYIDVAASWYIE